MLSNEVKLTLTHVARVGLFLRDECEQKMVPDGSGMFWLGI